ncbi:MULTISPECIES: hypothetical protein [Serratia]|uniref:Uncharacterized protein n=1 Tax=Serratia proteamaculans TaxID=28151 RepID=A0ABS0TYG5_SERPR|nr:MULTISPECIES: hypothetical protein [Serratia]MBI6183415.1 hypothetical protein [Serratia proteamaculans]
MTEPKKAPAESKSQPVEQQKPTPAKQGGFSVGRMIAADSAEGLKKKSK